MKMKRYENIVAIAAGDGSFYGFHAHNLDIAELDAAAWDAMSATTDPDVKQELQEWSEQQAPETSDLDYGKKVNYLSINIAQVCNLKCTYCGAGGDGTYGTQTPRVDVSAATRQLKFFLDKMEAGEDFSVRFLGGEPLLYPSAIRQIADFARLSVAGRNINLQFFITTNGTLVTPKVAELLADLNAHVSVSFDGPDEINDVVRPIKSQTRGSSSVLTQRGLEELVKVRNRLSNLKVNAVFGNHNMQVVKAYEYFNSYSFDLINLNYAANDEDEKYSALYVEHMREIASLAYKAGGLEALGQISQFYQILRQLEAKERKHDYCGAGKNLVQADTRNDLYACNWFMDDGDEKIGHGNTLDEEKVVQYSPSLIELNNCHTCWARHLCGGGCMFVHKTKTGNKHGKDPHFCQRTRALAAIAIEYYARTLKEELNEAH